MSAALVVEDEDHEPQVISPEVLKVGLLGCGTVGSPVAKALLEDCATLRRAAGVPLELARVAVRDPYKARPVRLPPGIVTTDALAVAIDPDIDIVIEVIGGVEPALGTIVGALSDNKSVVTANKELLAGVGADLLGHPDSDLFFEASVCAAIPIVRTLTEHYAADRIESITGIFSGTCNFVLSTMTARRCSFADALAEARRLGYAEADPTADIEAFDAAAKVAILARVAFGVPATIDDVEREGISGIDSSRIAQASREGLVCKLVGGARRAGERLELWVKPQFLPRDHALARIEGVDNAVLVQSARAGCLALHGRGAGGDPTAAAVLADVTSAARRRVRGRTAIPCLAPAEPVGLSRSARLASHLQTAALESRSYG